MRTYEEIWFKSQVFSMEDRALLGIWQLSVAELTPLAVVLPKG